MNKLRLFILVITLLMTSHLDAKVKLASDIQRLQQAYPHFIAGATPEFLLWKDGSTLPLHDNHPLKSEQEKLDNPSLADQLQDNAYFPGTPLDTASFTPSDDSGRIRHLPFFQKMYGATKAEVEKKLVTVFWMPKVFGQRYPLLVTTVNDVDKKLVHLSAELELLPAQYYRYLDHPSGAYRWRVINQTQRLSMHSFGITIDLNAAQSNYWQWDLKKSGVSISEDQSLTYRNNIPWEIVQIFEKHGFIWGGKWLHYDTMHFEYRPELLH